MNPTLKSYEPPTRQEGTALIPGHEDLLAPGVRGYAIEKDNEIRIPLIIAEREGTGDVGRFLDRLSQRCVVVSVTSNRLAGMLKRRDWKQTFVKLDGEKIDEWRRP